MAPSKTLSAKQQAALARSSGPDKHRLRAEFHAQKGAVHVSKAQKSVRSARPKPGKVDKLPSAGDIFDPTNGLLVPTIASEGLAFPVMDKAIGNITVDTGATCILILNNPGNCGTIMTQIDVDSSNIVSRSAYTCPHFSGTPATYCRAMKAAVSMVNTTKLLDQGGRVYMLHLNQRLTLPAEFTAMTGEEWKSTASEIKSNPDARPFSGAEFVHEKRFVSHPSNQTNYLKYREWGSVLTASAHSQFWTTATTAPEKDRSMSTIIIVITDPPANQTYAIAAYGAWYARYPLTSLVSRAQVHVPTASPALVNAQRDKAELYKDVARGLGKALRAAVDYGPQLALAYNSGSKIGPGMRMAGAIAAM